MLQVIGALALGALPCAVPAQTAAAPAQSAAVPPAKVASRQGAAAPDAAAVNARVNAPLPADQASMKAHVMFLASDAMRGREAGSPEYDIAAQYVAAQFYAAGLKPAGDDGGYLQRVPLVAYRAADKGDLVLTRKGPAPASLVFGEDYSPGANPARRETVIDAPVVFVGYGIVAPHMKRDDYAGVDVKGKIVAYFGGAPDSFQSEERAHFASGPAKATIAAGRGAIGTITLDRPALAGARPFARIAQGWDRSRTVWANPDGTGFGEGAPGLATLSAAGAAKLFAGAGTPWPEVLMLARNNEARFKAEQLPGSLAVVLRTAYEPATSSNVAGIIPGGDPVAGREVVILSAHLDHVGIGAAVKGDTIYNGAEDNAVGVASLIEEARRFKASGKAPRRTVMFLAVTAEEKGLVGSDYFARHPTVPRQTIVANVNLDMPLLTYKFDDVIAFGADRSTLGPIVRKAAASMGVGFSPDPDPAQAIFVRSDHYRFVQQGVPSVFLWPGQAGAGKAAYADFFAKHYHKPSDEVSLPLDWAQGVRFVDANYAIAREIADGPDRPRWNKGDFFGMLYNGYGAR